jgi:hypothetical protein
MYFRGSIIPFLGAHLSGTKCCLRSEFTKFRRPMRTTSMINGSARTLPSRDEIYGLHSIPVVLG